LTFLPIEIVLRYLHYGDQLTIIEFNENDRDIENCNIYENGGNKGCFNTNKYRVGKIMSFGETNTIDYIFEHINDTKKFEETLIVYSNLVIPNLLKQ
jgi:hypothetical protein